MLATVTTGPETPAEALAAFTDLVLRPETLLAAAGLGAWFLLLRAILVATRPAGPPPAPATQDLGGDEPPAVVSLLVNRWAVTVDAVESTLLDLAARGVLELRQNGDDPRQTTIHVLPDAAPLRGPDQLTGYEEHVLGRVRRLARGDVLPITALAFRDAGEAGTWTSTFDEKVRDDARARGYSRPRVSGGQKRLLTLTALLPGAAIGLAVRAALTDDPFVGGFFSGLFSWVALTAIGAQDRGERDTAAGRAAAGRWNGLRRWMENDDAFRALPPAAVAVWHRYLPYGTALGVCHVCSAVLDLGMGERKLVWSSFGGTWHRVRVRYPRFWRRYGETAGGLITGAAIYGAVAAFALVRRDDVVRLIGDVLQAVSGADARRPETVRTWLTVVALVVVVRAGYRILRTLVDLATAHTMTAEVLWVELWKTTPGKGEDDPPVPVLYYLAVDDGSSDRTTAWALPAELLHVAKPPDHVTLTVRPWSRRVVTIVPVPAPDAERV